VQWTLAQGWPGLENLSLIPGTVGAAPIQNIGAYGLEVGECLHAVTAWDFAKQPSSASTATTAVSPTATAASSRKAGTERRHRHHLGRLPPAKAWQPNCRYADVAQELAARHIAAPTARDIAAVIAVRQRKLPDPASPPTPAASSTTRCQRAQADALKAAHPTLPCYPQPDGRVKLAAGWLIEQAGWKGKTLGPVGMYEKQALVLVNQGGATGDDVKRTMAAVQADVLQRFGVALTPEPIFL
jgi:UDP-N-acetylmuramate dehydrogenase